MTFPLPSFTAATVRCRGHQASGRRCNLVLLREPWRSLGMGEDCAERAGLVVAGRSRAVVGSGPDLLDMINEGDKMIDSRYPTHRGQRAALREENARRIMAEAALRGERHGRSMKCGGVFGGAARLYDPPRHAGEPDGCANDGTGCLCSCHDPKSV